jgi:AraC-like DNA-binding protein
MKAKYEQLSGQINNSFLYRQFSLPEFNAPYHFHPELELTLIKKSKGTRFIGRQIATFEAGDLVLLGANLPHCWVNSTDGSDFTTDAAQSIVIQFKENFMGDDFKLIPEMVLIHQLFKKAQSGILIKGKTRALIQEKMQISATLNPFYQLINLLEILYLIANSEELELIDTQFSSYSLSSIETERFQKVYAHIIENYTQDIDLETIAAISNLTPTAFCRYFKKITRKTLIEVIIEFRIKHACQLLNSTDKAVADICFDSGFGNISYFNKTFKQVIGHNPLAYRKLFLTI